MLPRETEVTGYMGMRIRASAHDSARSGYYRLAHFNNWRRVRSALKRRAQKRGRGSIWRIFQFPFLLYLCSFPNEWVATVTRTNANNVSALACLSGVWFGTCMQRIRFNRQILTTSVVHHELSHSDLQKTFVTDVSFSVKNNAVLDVYTQVRACLNVSNLRCLCLRVSANT